MKSKTQFGMGLTYNLGLFLAHEKDDYVWGQKKEELKKSTSMNEEHMTEMWFNSSSDHLYDLEISKKFPLKLQKKIRLFQDKCLNWGHGFGIGGWKYGKPNQKSVEWALEEARTILREIDKFLKIKSKKGDFQ